MGSFNVACSISSLSISPGQPVVFIPLLPNRMNQDPREIGHQIYPASLLIYPYCYFNPFSLPIKGVYGDYGYVEEIQEDENTKAIEHFFGITIKQFVDCVTGREPSFYIVDKKLDDYDFKFGAKYLKRLGFSEVAKDIFRFGEFHYFVELLRSGKGETSFSILDEKMDIVARDVRHDKKDSFLREFQKLTGYYLNVSQENQKRMRVISRLSGMYIHGKVFEGMTRLSFGRDPDLKSKSLADNYFTEDIAAELGFEKISRSVQKLFDPHAKSLWRKPGFPYDVKIGKYGTAIVHQKHKEYYVFGDERYCKEILSAWMEATGSDPKETFPFPKNIKKVTQEEFKSIEKAFKKLTGARMGWAEKDRYDVYSVKQFAEVWKKLTGKKLGIGKYAKLSLEDAQFGRLQADLIRFDNPEPQVEKLKYGPVEIQKSMHENEQRLKELLALDHDEPFLPEPFIPHQEDEEYEADLSRMFRTPFDDPLSRSCSGEGSEYVGIFREWRYFSALYREMLKRGELREIIAEYRLFYWRMYSCNRFFFPAMNGEQFGNPKASEALSKLVLDIARHEIKRREE